LIKLTKVIPEMKGWLMNKGRKYKAVVTDSKLKWYMEQGKLKGVLDFNRLHCVVLIDNCNSSSSDESDTTLVDDF